jgi:flagellar protein FlaF
MSQKAYKSALKSAETPRQAEYRLFAEVTAALADAKQRAASGPDLVAALDWNRRLWSALSADCGSTANGLPRELRAQIISVGIWVSRYASEVARGQADIDPLIDVNRSIMEGLSLQSAGLANRAGTASVQAHA